MALPSEIISPHVIEALREEIRAANGVEIFAILSREDDEDRFHNLTVVSRGTPYEVPAILSRTSPGDMTLHNHPSGVLQPSQADMRVATALGEEGVGSMIINNDVSGHIVIVEPAVEGKPVEIEEAQVTAVFGEKGTLSRKFANYEAREAQVDMAKAVAKNLNNNEILVVEAGTGTGKSLAYLVPSLLWTRENKGRVVIATKTIALQEQLVFKDIPLARSVVPEAPHAALVKGRQNYICLRKQQDLRVTQLELFADEEKDLKREIESLGRWMEQGGSGDRADLPFMPSFEAWDSVRSDSDMCLGAKCPFYQKSPFYSARRASANARVLIVNQALLFSDLAVRMISKDYKAAAVIPPYEHVILDEAHSIEDIATDHFGEKVASFGLRLTLGKILSASGKSNKGTLHRLFQGAVEFEAHDFARALDEELYHRYREKQEAVIGQLYNLSRALHEHFNPDQYKNLTIWLKPEVLESEKMAPAKAEAKELLNDLVQLMMVLGKIRQKASTVQSEKFVEKMEGTLIELDARKSRLDSVITALKTFAISQDPNKVPWLVLKRTRSHEEFEYKVSPLDVSPMLREGLYNPFKSVTMTSATLDLKDNFEFLSTRNGLAGFGDKPWQFMGLKSPFDYSKQARLLLTKTNGYPGSQGYEHDLADLILQATFGGCRGGTLVLFTSYAMLNRVANLVEMPLARGGIELLVQGRHPRMQLLKRMKQSHGVLLGTDSFWEGVDLPGDALTKVVIARLPFRQMGDPIFEARCARIEAQGQSSFSSYSLPLALLKFKQGAGRLIRKADDRGYLIVADNRITEKGYGRRFMELVDEYPYWQSEIATLEHTLVPLEVWR